MASLAILRGIEGVLRGTVQAGELKRQLADRKRQQRLQDLQFNTAEQQFNISEQQFAESQINPQQRRERALVRGNILTVERDDGLPGPADARLPVDSPRTQEEINAFIATGQPLLTARDRQRSKLVDLQIQRARQPRALSPFQQFQQFPDEFRQFQEAQRAPRPARQIEVKTPEGQFNVTLDAQGNEINRVPLGDLLPSTSAASTQVDLSKFPTLTKFDVLASRNLAVKMFGARAGNRTDIVELIMGLKTEGLTEDEIGDRLLTEQTSSEFVGPIRNAFEFVTRKGFSKDQRNTNRDTLDRIVEVQGEAEAREFLLGLARDKGSAKEQSQIGGRDEALLALDKIEELILVKDITGPLRGRFEKFQQRFTGLTGNERLALIDQEIALAVIDYRQAKSGAAFTESEERLYERIFPSIQNSTQLNLVKIKSLREAFGRNQRAFYIRQLGKRNYVDLFGAEGVPQTNQTEAGDADLEDLFEEMGGND